VGVRNYAQGKQPLSVPPFVWLQAGIEGSFTQARAWTGQLSVGFSWAPELHNAFMIEARFSRLVSGPAASLTRPDLYVFVGAAAFEIRGQDALVFQNSVPSISDVINQANGRDPQQAFGSFEAGLEMRVKNRIAAGLFAESLPGKTDAPSLGQYFDVGVKFQSVGAEVSFWF